MQYIQMASFRLPQRALFVENNIESIRYLLHSGLTMMMRDMFLESCHKT